MNKIIPEEVKERMREEIRRGVMQHANIARKYGVAHSTITKMKREMEEGDFPEITPRQVVEMSWCAGK